MKLIEVLGDLGLEELPDVKALDYDAVIEVPRIGPGAPFNQWSVKNVRKDTKNGRVVITVDEPIKDEGA